MTEAEATVAVRRIYLIILAFTLFGFVAFLLLQGWRSAVGYAFGAVISFGNFWLSDWVTRSIVPEAGSSVAKKSWPAALFALRYLLMVGLAYVIVKTLGISGLPVVLGILTSTTAAVTTGLFDAIRDFWASSSHKK